MLSPSPPKKKRGRPRKSETTPVSEKRNNNNRNTAKPASTNAVDRQARAKAKPRVSQSDQNTAPSGDAKPLVGQSVHGVVDGSFDAGYLVTIRVGATDTVYRGVVFGPGLSIPVNNDNDVTPTLKSNKEDAVSPQTDSPSLTPPVAAVPTPAAALLPTPVEAPTRNPPPFPITPAPVGVGSSLAPAAFRSSFDQETMAQYMYPDLSQLHSGGSDGFFPRGFYPFQLPTATDYASANAQFAAANAQGAALPPRLDGS